jgi:HSP20 family protein
MAITSPWGDWSPLEELERLRRDLSRTFGYGARRAGGAALRICEDPEVMTIDVEMPGVEPDAIDLSATGDMITLKSERPVEDPEKVHAHRRERWTGAVTRSVAIPAGYDGQQLVATCRDGLLTMRIPRRESAKPRQITIGKS